MVFSTQSIQGYNIAPLAGGGGFAVLPTDRMVGGHRLGRLVLKLLILNSKSQFFDTEYLNIENWYWISWLLTLLL